MVQDSSAFKLPFDFANYSVIKYDKNRLDTWKKTLNKRLIECINNYHYRDNPVAMTFAQHDFSIISENPQAENVKQLQSALDLIKQMVDIGFDIDWIQQLMASQTKTSSQVSPVIGKKSDNDN